MSGVRWEVERDRFGVMFSGPLEVGEVIEVMPAPRREESTENFGTSSEFEEALAIIGVLTERIEGLLGTGRPTSDPEEIALYERIDRLRQSVKT